MIKLDNLLNIHTSAYAVTETISNTTDHCNYKEHKRESFRGLCTVIDCAVTLKKPWPLTRNNAFAYYNLIKA